MSCSLHADWHLAELQPHFWLDKGSVAASAYRCGTSVRFLYLGGQSEPLEASWQARAATARIVVIHNESQVTRVELVVCWHLTEAPDTGLDQVLQIRTGLQLCTSVEKQPVAVRWEDVQRILALTAYLTQGFAFAFKALNEVAPVLDVYGVQRGEETCA